MLRAAAASAEEMCVSASKHGVEHGRQRAGRGGCSSLCLGPWSKALHALKWSGCSISISSCPGTFHILVFNIYMWVITMLLPSHILSIIDYDWRLHRVATGWLVLLFPLYARVIWANLLSNYIKDVRSWVFDGSCYKCHMLTGQKESYMKVLWWEFTLQGDWVSFRISHHSAEGWGGRTRLQQASESSRRTGDDCSQEVSVGPCRCCRARERRATHPRGLDGLRLFFLSPHSCTGWVCSVQAEADASQRLCLLIKPLYTPVLIWSQPKWARFLTHFFAYKNTIFSVSILMKTKKTLFFNYIVVYAAYSFLLILYFTVWAICLLLNISKLFLLCPHH